MLLQNKDWHQESYLVDSLLVDYLVDLCKTVI